ncbi:MULTISPECIES: ABC transporter substrate-binding protein [Devosia]|uniref:Probable sugar-binding periplasmic protein n=1 Tax=Devosia equisanguinis TaxID=2490941 RepID=A0A447IF68_9HYPH|nr:MULTISPECIES: ABC transporter substrate-binding protein [Devosia]ODT49131.1 MAG: ABC transporter substrate-binding protein [Pelagibacterium sp. SCN 63-126]ODU80204.1 MAG: ABC transporter substrate-binding protein [Pelagibacterium sp. SCN 63-17]OJX43351.1 MAG: ABC transporter substrate-binding protein [Devosia sp. 63-57]VDS06115.1 putative sugar-binding periplasmic protein precursor [Devosia equisanguinis]
MKKFAVVATLATAFLGSTAVFATDLEVTHWWTSGGEAAAVAELAKAFDASGDKWIDGAIAGGGGTARPIMISRITGGDPMGATQFNHGQQALELVEAGLMLDLTDVAEANNWKEVIYPPSLLDACTVDGRVYCAPVNIHSPEWLWLSNKAFEDAGIPVPTNWNEFVAAGPALEAAGKIPLALGNQPWQSATAFGAIAIGVAGLDVWKQVNIEKNMDVAAGPEYAAVFQAVADARALAANSNVQDWNQATNLVITGEAGGQIMGDWAQGEFQVAGQVAGEDYTCLPGLGLNAYLSTGGDAFYFPKLNDPEKEAAQKRLAALLVSPEVQVAFNLKKGSLPIRGDVDLGAANDCMKKGLELLASGNILPSGDMVWSPDVQKQNEDLMVEFWNSDMAPEVAHQQWVANLKSGL